MQKITYIADEGNRDNVYEKPHISPHRNWKHRQYVRKTAHIGQSGRKTAAIWLKNRIYRSDGTGNRVNVYEKSHISAQRKGKLRQYVRKPAHIGRSKRETAAFCTKNRTYQSVGQKNRGNMVEKPLISAGRREPGIPFRRRDCRVEPFPRRVKKGAEKQRNRRFRRGSACNGGFGRLPSGG